MESDRDPVAEGGTYAPTSALADASTYTDLGRFTVDDEMFAVRRRDEDGSCHYDWISGPNDGYGFSVFCGPGPLGGERHIAAIRDFLAGIDPETGYLSYP